MNTRDDPSLLAGSGSCLALSQALAQTGNLLQLARLELWLPTPDGRTLTCAASWASDSNPAPHPPPLETTKVKDILAAIDQHGVFEGRSLRSFTTPPSPSSTPGLALYLAATIMRASGFLHAEHHPEAQGWAPSTIAALRAIAAILPVLIGLPSETHSREEIEQTVSMLSGTLESTTEGIVVVGLDRLIRLVNRRFLEIVGAPRQAGDSLKGTLVRDVLMPLVTDPDRLGKAAETLYSNPEMRIVVEIEFKDGRIFELSSVPQQIDGRIIGRIFSYRDITAKVRSEQARTKLEHKLQQARKLEAIGTLASGIAHDFNNILNAIACNVKVARDCVPESHPAVASLDNIETATRYAAEILRQILAVGRQNVENRGMISIQALIQDVVNLLQPTLPPSVSVVSRVSANLGSVNAASALLRQALMNLCINAAHAIGDTSGKITLQAATVIVDQAMADDNPDLHVGRYMTITVTDTGCGMDATIIDRIFEPFFTTKPKGKGVGLGLPVVYGIMKAHHGAIDVTSEPGKGTTFTLYLPMP